MRQSRTCSCAYHFVSSSPSLQCVVKARHPDRQEKEQKEHDDKPGENLQFPASSLHSIPFTSARAIHKLDTLKIHCMWVHPALPACFLPDGSNATEEIHNTGGDQAIEDLGTPLFIIDNARSLEQREVTGNGGHFGTDQLREFANAAFAAGQFINHEETAGMPKSFEDPGLGLEIRE